MVLLVLHSGSKWRLDAAAAGVPAGEAPPSGPTLWGEKWHWTVLSLFLLFAGLFYACHSSHRTFGSFVAHFYCWVNHKTNWPTSSAVLSILFLERGTLNLEPDSEQAKSMSMSIVVVVVVVVVVVLVLVLVVVVVVVLVVGAVVDSW